MTCSIIAVVASRPLLRRAVVPLAAFAGVVVAGVAGFVLLGGVGVVEAAFWLVDLTSVELHFEGADGPETATKAYAVLVTVGLVVTGLWVGETALSAAFGGRMQEELRYMQTNRSIDELEDHVIICGYGMFGQTIAERVDGNGDGVVVIELDETEFERALGAGVLALQGDARREETLREAGIERARTLVTAVDDSNANIQTAITAGQIAPTVRLVVRVGDAMYEPLARRAGADEVIIPEVVSGEQVTESL
ncbi:potassium channel family protein [Halalkalicoccus subterraneus]|uniref:potassium channel family protein n=1 Tax=Halalkalicoccus subterraneus TaxID=2675002 RepID=UPI001B872E86|nr:NAD(P)-binding protein [Halalkalicoccus subterraneus]